MAYKSAAKIEVSVVLKDLVKRKLDRESSKMDWLLNAPQISSAFASLGSKEGDIYVVSPNALSILEEINCKLTYEDQTLRTYRRAIGFGQDVRVSLIPLLINTKDPRILDATVRILVNLTVPLECLFSVDLMYRTETGRHTIFEINRLLLSSKEAFTDAKSTKSVLDYVKFIIENDSKLSTSHIETINNCLLLLRNILHIPETNMNFILSQTPQTSMQNTILWNLFIQSVDKLLIYLLSCPMRKMWAMTMIQLIAVMYKDQHTNTLQKLLNTWFDASITDSSGDNESNTSPSKQLSGDSSPMLTSDPTSDSSDNGSGKKNQNAGDRRHALNIETEATLQEVSRKGHEYQNAILKNPAVEKHNSMDFSDSSEKNPKPTEPTPTKASQSTSPSPPKSNSPVPENGACFKHPGTSAAPAQKSPHCGNLELVLGKSSPQKREYQSSQSEQSDYGYATQVEHQASISTSSNEDDSPQDKPVHQKPPCNQKQRSKTRTPISQQDCKDLRRKKLVKRGKSSLINMKSCVLHIPTDDDISNILKEFTVDFLLKGFGYLVHSLHTVILANVDVQTDTSHFLWLLTYFLKFAPQLELDFEHIRPIVNYGILSYLTYEGVNLSEQIELSSRQKGNDIKPYTRRIHLVVTTIREFFLTLESYTKISHLTKEDKRELQILEIQIVCTNDLRDLFILLIRKFNASIHTRQYLQDLIVTNHMLMLLVDKVHRREPEVDKKIGTCDLVEHISQFATVEVMNRYGQLLENFNDNGGFVNDCIFTMMHHISGDLGQVMSLFQPTILKTFNRIWQTDYQLCDDWLDLIEYVIHKFTNTSQKSSLVLPCSSLTEMTKEHNLKHTVYSWNQEEMDTLYWYYVQSKKAKDIVGQIETLFAKNGNERKSRLSIIQQLLQQDIITLVEYDNLMRYENATYQRNLTKTPTNSSTADSGVEVKTEDGSGKPCEDIQTLKNIIIKDGKHDIIHWLQKVLLECCYVKLTLTANRDVKLSDIDVIMEPVAYHCILQNKSVPIVPWNTQQANMMLYQPFVLLLHKLGFQLPIDSGSAYPRVPEFWSPQTIYSISKKLGPLDKTLIKFESCELDGDSSAETVPPQPTKENIPPSSPTILDKDSFVLPQVKSSTAIIRHTPDSASNATVPNWLQVVMRSKSTSEDTKPDAEHIKPEVVSPTPPTSTAVTPTIGNDSQIKTPADQTECNREDSLPNSDGGNGNSDSMYKAMIASVYEKESKNLDPSFVSSALTRMYVSDDEDL